MRLALAQMNTVVGDLDGNVERIAGRLAEARDAGADLVLFPELAVTGYPPEDLLLRPGFIRAARRRVEELATRTHGITALVGAPHLDADLYNACFVLADGEIKGVYRKRFLPNYGVFDEDRYFAPGNDLFLLRFGEVLVGPTICEDIWQPGPPATDLALAGAQLIANISASPFHVGKDREREEMLRVRARDNSCFVALCNAVGGQDELLFDGNSVVIDDEGEVVARAPGFEEALLVVDVDPAAAVGRRLRDLRRRALARERDEPRVTRIDFGEPRAQEELLHPQPAAPLGDLEQMRLALELGLRDYVDKNGFGDVVVGLSGGIDSALTAALARRGARRRSRARRLDAVALLVRGNARRRRAARRRRSGSTSASSRSSRWSRRSRRRSRGAFAGREPDLTEENLQARIRGTLLMALSNKFGWLVIATGNKSELSVGYSTLYGDLAGGFALLKDVYKTDVFRLSRWLNERAGRELIPVSIIERAPSAELRADQRDEDSLPPYSELDRVLEAYVELDRSREELAAGRLRSGRGRPRARDDRPRRVQAPPGPARRQAPTEGLRSRPAHADHEPLARIAAVTTGRGVRAPRRGSGRRSSARGCPADDDERGRVRCGSPVADLALEARAETKLCR